MKQCILSWEGFCRRSYYIILNDASYYVLLSVLYIREARKAFGSFTSSSNGEQLSQNHFGIILISMCPLLCPNLHAEWGALKLVDTQLFCNIAISWTNCILQIQVKCQQRSDIDLSFLIIVVTVCVYGCVCLLYKTVRLTHTHTH